MSTRYTYDQPEYLDVEGAKFLVAEIKEYINLVITGGVDLSTYATKEYVDNAVSNVSVDLSDYATKQYVDNAIANSGGNTDEPTEPEPSEPTEPTVSLAITFKGSQELKIGGSTKTLTAKYTDSTSTDVSANYTTTWNVSCDKFSADDTSLLEYTITGNTLKINVLDRAEDYIGAIVTVTATSSDGSLTDSKVFDIVSLF